jgi:hypothetical protein
LREIGELLQAFVADVDVGQEVEREAELVEFRQRRQRLD